MEKEAGFTDHQLPKKQPSDLMEESEDELNIESNDEQNHPQPNDLELNQDLENYFYNGDSDSEEKKNSSNEENEKFMQKKSKKSFYKSLIVEPNTSYCLQKINIIDILKDMEFLPKCLDFSALFITGSTSPQNFLNHLKLTINIVIKNLTYNQESVLFTKSLNEENRNHEDPYYYQYMGLIKADFLNNLNDEEIPYLKIDLQTNSFEKNKYYLKELGVEIIGESENKNKFNKVGKISQIKSIESKNCKKLSYNLIFLISTYLSLKDWLNFSKINSHYRASCGSLQSFKASFSEKTCFAASDQSGLLWANGSYHTFKLNTMNDNFKQSSVKILKVNVVSKDQDWGNPEALSWLEINILDEGSHLVKIMKLCDNIRGISSQVVIINEDDVEHINFLKLLNKDKMIEIRGRCCTPCWICEIEKIELMFGYVDHPLIGKIL